MGGSATEVPLLERAEMPEFPSIPKEAQQDLSVLERDFVNAEVELSMYLLLRFCVLALLCGTHDLEFLCGRISKLIKEWRTRGVYHLLLSKSRLLMHKNQIVRLAIPIMRPLYARRNELVTKKLQQADFWPRVFANSPPEIDEYIRPSDAQIIGSCLKNLTIDRFEVNEKGEGEPRSVRFVFEFSNGEENIWFEESKIVKEFHWRKHVTTSPSGKPRIWEGLVSDPVRIRWKKDMDPTRGLLDAACDLVDAEKALLKKESKDKLSAEERTKLPQYEHLVEKTAQFDQEVQNEGEADDDEGESSPAGISFFAWFGYRGRDVTAADSERAGKEEQAAWDKINKGEGDDDEDSDDDDDDDDALEDAEIFPDGEGLALALGDDLWPNALKRYGKRIFLPCSL